MPTGGGVNSSGIPRVSGLLLKGGIDKLNRVDHVARHFRSAGLLLLLGSRTVADAPPGSIRSAQRPPNRGRRRVRSVTFAVLQQVLQWRNACRDRRVNERVDRQLRAATGYEESHACAVRSWRACYGVDTTQQGGPNLQHYPWLPLPGQSGRTGKRRPALSRATPAVRSTN